MSRIAPRPSLPSGLTDRQRFGVSPGEKLSTGRAVDLLSQDVSMASVSCGLLNHVDEDPSKRQRLRGRKSATAELLDAWTLINDLVVRDCGCSIRSDNGSNRICGLQFVGRNFSLESSQCILKPGHFHACQMLDQSEQAGSRGDRRTTGRLFIEVLQLQDHRFP